MLYLEDKIGPKNIGLMFGVDKMLVQQWLREQEIPRHGSSESAKIRMHRSLRAFGKDLKEIDVTYFSHEELQQLAEERRITPIW